MAKKQTTHETVPALVRRLENQFVTGNNQTSKYVNESPYEDINKIFAYLESKHTSGELDSQGREKPFFNISVAARNIWFRATDRDRKNYRIRIPKVKQTFIAFIANVLLQNYMRRENFGAFLNKWGLDEAGFNSSVVKFVEKDGRLHTDVIPWNRIIFDAIDFANNPKIEILELTEAQLRQRKGYDQEMVDKLCNARSARQNLDKTRKDTKSDYIKLYEVHGELPLSLLTGKAKDEDTYVQQMHVISYVASKDNGGFDDFTLISGREAKDPYMLTALIPTTDGSVSFNGAVKQLFEAQWMVNHTVKAIKDQLDLASKLIFQTSDGNFVGQNALSAIESGDILVHQLNQPLTQLANNSHDITSLQNFQTAWKAVGNEMVGISESMLGANPPAGTAWRQTQALLQESHSLFDLMKQNKDLDVESMLRVHIIPFLKKQMDTSEEISAILESYDIQKVDAKYIKNKSTELTNKQLVDMVIDKHEVTPETQAMLMQAHQVGLKEALNENGNQRFFTPDEVKDTTWKELLKDFEWEVETVPEENDDQTAMTTLDTLFKTIVAMGGRPMTPDEKMVFNKILTLAGTVSPIELSNSPQPLPAQPTNGGSMAPDMGGKLPVTK